MSVYVITDRAAGVCKIGYSAAPRKRLATLATSTAADLRLEAAIPGDVNCERALHLRFRDQHIRREWFCITAEIEDLISQYECPPQPCYRAERSFSEKLDVRIQMVAADSEIDALDAWRATQTPPIWSRSEAIRQLIADGIRAKKG